MMDQKEHENESFRNLDFSGEVFNGFDFFECEFINCNLSSSGFKNTRFTNCEFKQCDLSLVKVDKSTLSGVMMNKSKVLGVDWAAANWAGNRINPILKTIDFVECVMNYSNFSGLQLGHIQIVKCVAHEVNFTDTNLKGAVLRDTDFEKSVFHQTNLEGADLIGARNYYISPTDNQIKKAKFSMPEAMALLYSMDIVIEDRIEE